VAADLPIHATKIGMLANAAVIEAVAAAIERHRLTNVVLDPVMIAKSGAALLDPAAVDALRARLLPLADVVTPNAPEAAALTGQPVTSIEDLRRAAAALVDHGARAALVKGGHLTGPAVDVLWDGRRFTELTADRIGKPPHARLGCTLSRLSPRGSRSGTICRRGPRREACVTRDRRSTRARTWAGPLQHFRLALTFQGNEAM
jgi:hydroxymethylpyrimidine/phosphomethylpyrimidine kinase